MHHPPFDVMPRLFTLLRRQFLSDGLELLLHQIATLGPVCTVLLGEGGVDLADLVPLFGRQGELLGCFLESFRQRVTDLTNLRPFSLGAGFLRSSLRSSTNPFTRSRCSGVSTSRDGFELRLEQFPALSRRAWNLSAKAAWDSWILVRCSGVSPSWSATVCSRSDTVSRSCSRRD